LEGKRKLDIRCWDDVAKHEMYGRRPVFVFDPTDQSNAALPRDRRSDPAGEAGDNAIEFWRVYPQFLKDHFLKAFMTGLRDPGARIPVSEWRATLVRLRDGIVYCGACGEQNFTEFSGKVVGANCFNKQCGQPVTVPFRLTVGHRSVMLNADTVLYPHHVDAMRSFDFGSPVARLRQHPTQPHVWGLANLSAIPWTGQLPGGHAVDVPPGRSLPLAAGTRIHFGSAEGVISL
jgi:hypothetical protein